jgi:acyl-CoA thioesterase-2
MNPSLQDLLNVLEPERLEINIFRGVSRDIGSAQVFGGQVLGQALRAASNTVEPDRLAHSLHAYFLRRGDFNAPIIYFVDRSRDGFSFTNRRVTAIQHGEQIFHMAASFQTEQAGVEHQTQMPDVPSPESLAPTALISHVRADALPHYDAPFEFRMVQTSEPVHHMWIRAVDALPDDEVLHRCLLAYVSDFHLLNAATLPHAKLFESGRKVTASIDHAMWFHRPIRLDQWFLCSNVSPSASGARGFARGSVYTREGVLAASTAQEGLVRLLDAPQAAAKRPL